MMNKVRFETSGSLGILSLAQPQLNCKKESSLERIRLLRKSAVVHR